MRQVIVNADDFGINEIVTKEIENEILAGRVTSTTVMANGSCLEEVRGFAGRHPEVSFGVHLCLSEFNSLTRSDVLMSAGLVDDDGRFINKAVFREKEYDSVVLKAIRIELDAQIETVSSLGIDISHADSHHHVHTIYPLKELFRDVLKQHGIKRIRLGGEFRSLRKRLHLARWIKRNRLNSFFRNTFITTDAMYSYFDFLHFNCPIENGEIIELMCHPGHPEPKYMEEISLMDKELLPKDIKLITYNDLH